MPIEVAIPLDNTFDLKEGNYRAHLQTLSRKPNFKMKNGQDQIRFLFHVNIPSIRTRTPMAGRNFPMSLKAGSELRRFLEGWLGPDVFEKSCVRKFDLESLSGREAELTLIHFQQVGYAKPMVFIQSAHPVGSLELTEEPVEMGGKD